MSDLIRTTQLGDITFGVPGDIKLLNKPFGFYEFLGLPRGSGSEQIKKVYRKLAQEMHPDKGGKHEDFIALERVVSILLDDGGELGPEHSKRAHYDRVSALDDYFDGFISYKGERTRKLSEIMLIRMEGRRERAEVDLEISKASPRYSELKKNLERARSPESKEKIASELGDIVAEARGITPEMKEEIHKRIEEMHKKYEDEQMRFIDSLRKNMHEYTSKILDLFYAGGEGVTFGGDPDNLRLRFFGHEDKKHILELVIGGPCYISRFHKVHFKSEEADVKITNPKIEGIFHLIRGDITVDYEGSSYGSVIRARAPTIRNIQGFERNGDLFIPKRFATQNWRMKKPALDLAVHKGKISLQIESQEFSSKSYINDYYGNILGNYNNIEKICNNKIIYNKF